MPVTDQQLIDKTCQINPLTSDLSRETIADNSITQGGTEPSIHLYYAGIILWLKSLHQPSKSQLQVSAFHQGSHRGQLDCMFPGTGNVCCHPPELTGRTKPSYDQYSFNRDNNISQHLPGTYLKAKVPPDNTISYTNHPPFAFGSWELLLQSFLIFSFQDAEAQELGGPVGREEAQLCSAAHKAVRVVPVIYHSQLRLFRMHHFLGNPDLALR